MPKLNMDTINMWLSRDLTSGKIISFRLTHGEAEADAKRLQIPTFEVVQARVEFRIYTAEEIGQGVKLDDAK